MTKHRRELAVPYPMSRGFFLAWTFNICEVVRVAWGRKQTNHATDVVTRTTSLMLKPKKPCQKESSAQSQGTIPVERLTRASVKDIKLH